MKRPDPRKLPRLGLTGAVLAMVVLPATSSVPSVQEQLPPPPSEAEVRTLVELSAWVQGDHGRIAESPAASSLLTTIRDQRRSFEVFRTFNQDEARLRILSDLPYGGLIELEAEQYGLDSLLLAAMVQAESSFDPSVVSSRGALGLMQLMPETARRFGAQDPLDPGHNIAAGARYVSRLLRRFQGDLELALAAYNAGPGAVRRYGGVPPFRETRRYVERVLSTYVEYHRMLWQGTDAGELLLR